jgi:uncharacterized lipoprotein YehR (DUF1307 family)
MKKKLIAVLLMAFMIISLVGCGNTQFSTRTDTNGIVTQESTKKDDIKSTNPLDDLKKAFANAGLTVGENKQLAFSMLGATNGYKFDVNGSPIEIYYYDSKNLLEDQKKFYNQAKTGSIGMGGLNIPVVFKNDLMIVKTDEHPDKDKILEVFNNFKY